MILPSGTRVLLKGTHYKGEVTIGKETESKVIFDDGDGPDYWYYPNKELIVLKYENGQNATNIEKNFTYHPPKDDQPERYLAIRNMAKDLATTINQLTPASREQSLALTNLEQAVFWANAAIARNE